MQALAARGLTATRLAILLPVAAGIIAATDHWMVFGLPAGYLLFIAYPIAYAAVASLVARAMTRQVVAFAIFFLCFHACLRWISAEQGWGMVETQGTVVILSGGGRTILTSASPGLISYLHEATFPLVLGVLLALVVAPMIRQKSDARS